MGTVVKEPTILNKLNSTGGLHFGKDNIKKSSNGYIDQAQCSLDRRRKTGALFGKLRRYFSQTLTFQRKEHRSDSETRRRLGYVLAPGALNPCRAPWNLKTVCLVTEGPVSGASYGSCKQITRAQTHSGRNIKMEKKKTISVLIWILSSIYGKSWNMKSWEGTRQNLLLSVSSYFRGRCERGTNTLEHVWISRGLCRMSATSFQGSVLHSHRQELHSGAHSDS